MALASALSCNKQVITGVVSENITTVTCTPCTPTRSCAASFLPEGLVFSDGQIFGAPLHNVRHGFVYVYNHAESVKLDVDSIRFKSQE